MIGGIAFLGFKSRKFAISEPTQAPVPGSGIATNANKAKLTAVCNFLFSAICLFAFSVAKSIIFLKGFHLPKKSNKGLIYLTMK